MIRKALVRVDGIEAALFEEDKRTGSYCLKYLSNYEGRAISLSLPIRRDDYHFNNFPSFFDGVLPEGFQLEALLRKTKLDRSDYFGQLLEVGADLPGNVTVEWQKEEMI